MMSISLTEDVNECIHLHSFDEDFYATSPEKHTTHKNIVTIYILFTNSDIFGIEQPVLRDAVISLEKEADTMYQYLQKQYLNESSRFGGWIYADELNINKLLGRKQNEKTLFKNS